MSASTAKFGMRVLHQARVAGQRCAFASSWACLAVVVRPSRRGAWPLSKPSGAFNSPRNLFREGTPCVCLLGYPLCCGVPGFFVPATRACFVSVPACSSPAVSVLLVVRGGCRARACLRQAQHRQRSPCREQPGAGDRHRLGWLLQGLVGGLHSRGRLVAFAALLPPRRPRCLWRASAPRPHLGCPRGVIPDSFTTAARPLAVPLEHHAVCFGRLCMMGR